MVGQGLVYRMDKSGKKVFVSKNSCDYCEDHETVRAMFEIRQEWWLHEKCLETLRSEAVKKGYLW